MTYWELEDQFFRIQSRIKSYRLGQHFINMLIQEEVTMPEGLWEECNIEKARHMINDVIVDYQWDWDDLPVPGELK